MTDSRSQPTTVDVELLQQKLEFAEFEWNRATEGMKERDATIAALNAELVSCRACRAKVDCLSRDGTELAENEQLARGTAELAIKHRDLAEGQLASARKALEDLDKLLDFSDDSVGAIWHFDSTDAIQNAFNQAHAALKDIAK